MKFLKWLFLTPLFLFTLVSGAILTVLVWPQILINDTTLHWVARFAETKGVSLHWKALTIEVESLALLRKRFHLKAQDLCVQLRDPMASACAQTTDFSLAVRWTHFPPKIAELGPLTIGEMDWQWGEGKKLISGKVNIESGKETEGELRERGNWNFRTFRISGQADFPDRSQLTTHAIVNLKGDPEKSLQFTYFVDSNYQKKKSTLIAHLEGEMEPQRWRGKITARGDRWASSLPRFALNDCNWSLARVSRQEGTSKEGEFQLSCPVKGQIPIPVESIWHFEIPTQLGAHLLVNLRTESFPPTLEDKIKGTVQAVLDPVLSPLFKGYGSINADVEGRVNEFPLNGKIQTDLGIKLEVPRFEKLVRHLENTEWAVPAPANVFTGTWVVDIKGNSDLKSGQFPIQLATRLNSKTQTFDLDGSGLIQVEGLLDQPQPYFHLDLALSNVQLELPRLNWAAPPPLLPDARFQTQKTAASSQKAKIPFHYLIDLHTRSGHPIRVRSNLAQGVIPVNLNLVLSDSNPMRGSLRIESFPIEFMRRKAKVQYFDMELNSPLNESPIEGLVQMDYADYKMSIALLSTVGKPQIQLRSEPALPENQLVAALVFGRPLDELDPEQSASVGNARAAFTTGAMGLVSLYALASTPVQSVDYDPTTGRFAAKIRLGEGTSLNVGTNVGSATGTETADVGVRKRLGPFWTIETNVSSSPTGTGQVASAYLEWSHRY